MQTPALSISSMSQHENFDNYITYRDINFLCLCYAALLTNLHSLLYASFVYYVRRCMEKTSKASVHWFRQYRQDYYVVHA